MLILVMYLVVACNSIDHCKSCGKHFGDLVCWGCETGYAAHNSDSECVRKYLR